MLKFIIFIISSYRIILKISKINIKINNGILSNLKLLKNYRFNFLKTVFLLY